MNLPKIILNFKAYEQNVGKNAVEVAKKIDALGDDRIALAVQAADIAPVSNVVQHVSVYAQHIDAADFGKFTGQVHARSVKEAGASGTLLNHSEIQISMDKIKNGVLAAKKEGLQVCICADTPEKTREVASMGGDIVAVEQRELIGTGVSVSQANPKVVTDAIQLVKEVSDVLVYCGAGVTTKEDVQKAIELGTSGVILASALIRTPRPDKVSRELLDGLD